MVEYPFLCYNEFLKFYNQLIPLLKCALSPGIEFIYEWVVAHLNGLLLFFILMAVEGKNLCQWSFLCAAGENSTHLFLYPQQSECKCHRLYIFIRVTFKNWFKWSRICFHQANVNCHCTRSIIFRCSGRLMRHFNRAALKFVWTPLERSGLIHCYIVLLGNLIVQLKKRILNGPGNIFQMANEMPWTHARNRKKWTYLLCRLSINI